MSTYAVVSPFPQTDGNVLRTVIYKGVLYIGGSFSMVNGVPRDCLAAIDPVTGSVLPLSVTFNVGATVNDILFINDIMYVAGNFNAPRNFLAAFDLAGNLLAWNPDLNNPARTLATNGLNIFAGGDFTTVNAGAFIRNRAASFDLVVGTPTAWDPNINGVVYEILVVGSTVYAVGAFSTVNGATTRLSAAAFDNAVGTINAWDPSFNSAAYSLVSFGGLIYIGGGFSTLNAGSVSRQGVAAVDPTTGAAYLPFNAGAGYSLVFRVKERAGQLLVCGLINPAPLHNGFAVLNPADGSLLPPAVNLDNRVMDVEFLGTRFFFGGLFNSLLGDVVRNNLASFVLANNTFKSNTPSFNASVKHLIKISDVFYAFGSFTSVTGANGTFARFNAAAWDSAGNILPFDLGADGSILAAQLRGSTIYIGGQFSNVGGNPRSRAAAVDLTGAVLPWDPDVSGGATRVEVITTNGVNIFLGGLFTALNGGAVLRNNVAKVDPTVGTADPLWDPNTNQVVSSMISFGSYLYISGGFTTVSGQVRSGLARVPLTGTGSVDLTWIFDLGPFGASSCRAMSVDTSGTLYIAGNFTDVNGTSQALFARITSAPALDAAWSDAIAADGSQGTGILSFLSLVFLGAGTPNKRFGGEYRPLASSVNNLTGALELFGPAFGSGNILGFIVDFFSTTLYVFGNFNYVGIKEANFLLSLDIPAPPPTGLPQAPVIEFLNRKTFLDGSPVLTLFKWKPVVKDEQNNYVNVTGYRVYRTASMNLEDPVLVAEITTLDIRGFVDTMFTERIDGFYKYCVSAFNNAGEGGKSCTAGVGLAQSDRVG